MRDQAVTYLSALVFGAGMIAVAVFTYLGSESAWLAAAAGVSVMQALPAGVVVNRLLFPSRKPSRRRLDDAEKGDV